MDEDTISIHYNAEQIQEMGADEKLNLLVKIAIDNRATLREHGELLFGKKGTEGLVETVRSATRQIVWFWVVGAATVGFIATCLFQHLLRS